MASYGNYNEKLRKEAKKPRSQHGRGAEQALDKKYTQEEIDAANALLSLKHSAPAPPPGYTFIIIDPGTNPVPSCSAHDIKTPFPPQTQPIQPGSFRYQPTPLVSPVSPLVELDNFVATRFPGVMEETYQPSYQDFAATHPFSWMQCEAHGVWTCRQCFSDAVNH